jgi:flavodoxin
MNALVVYFSKFGNTALVAEAVAEVVTSLGSIRCCSLDELSPSDFARMDLVIMGVPTHRMDLPETVKEKFQSLPKRILRGIPVAAFDTSYKMSWLLSRFTASKHLNRKLRKLGGLQVIRPQTFHVVGREGPLYQGEIERARQWAASILVNIGKRQGAPDVLRSIG